MVLFFSRKFWGTMFWTNRHFYPKIPKKGTCFVGTRPPPSLPPPSLRKSPSSQVTWMVRAWWCVDAQLNLTWKKPNRLVVQGPPFPHQPLSRLPGFSDQPLVIRGIQPNFLGLENKWWLTANPVVWYRGWSPTPIFMGITGTQVGYRHLGRNWAMKKTLVCLGYWYLRPPEKHVFSHQSLQFLVHVKNDISHSNWAMTETMVV